MDTHTLAKALLEKPAVAIRLFYGVDPETQDSPEEAKFLTGPFDICFNEEEEMAVIMPVEAQGKSNSDVTEADIKRLFTAAELRHAATLKERWDNNETSSKDSLADILEKHVVTAKKLEYIDRKTGAENLRRYWAYALQAYLTGTLRP